MLKQASERLNAMTLFIDEDNPNEGPLKNRTVVIKDNVSTRNIETTASSGILIDYIPPYDATIITKLREAGAQLVGKTTLDELALGGTGLTPVQGPTKNPYHQEHIAGGSSSGSAALMGAHVVDFAIGSDTGDSVRKPAAYCGAVGFKPSYGRISRYGVIPYASSLDHVGYFTENVLDAALMLNVLAGRDDKDLTSSTRAVEDYTKITGDLKGKTIGILDNVLNAKSDDEIKEKFLELIETLKEKGAIIKTIHLDEKLLATLLPVYFIIANCEATANHANLDGIRFGQRQAGQNLEEMMTNSRTKGFGPLLKRRFVIGSYALDDEHQEKIFRKAQRVRRLIVNAYREQLSEVDAILTLSSDGVAPRFDQVNQTMSADKLLIENHLVLDNFAGTPSISIPLGHLNGLPYGVNLSSAPFNEKTLLDVAYGVEQCIDFSSKDREVNPWLMK